MHSASWRNQSLSDYTIQGTNGVLHYLMNFEFQFLKRWYLRIFGRVAPTSQQLLLLWKNEFTYTKTTENSREGSPDSIHNFGSLQTGDLSVSGWTDWVETDQEVHIRNRTLGGVRFPGKHKLKYVCTLDLQLSNRSRNDQHNQRRKPYRVDK